MSAVVQILVLAGALGVFLLGMKLMSEALQKVAGARLRSLLAKATSTPLSGVLTGLAVTSLVQSSSATTVMVVSFVNADLLSLVQAISVIMGANIGTTFTGWLVALLGFKIKITSFALPAVGIGFGMSFLRGAKVKQWGEALVGFGLLFLGLALLKDAVPAIDNPEELEWMASLASHGFGSVLIFVGIGTALTVILQSSSATMTLTLTLAALGWLPYEVAVAMVLGENIGTTATANIAAIGTNTAARRAARAHLVFNLFGVAWALALMHVYLLPVVDLITPGDPTTGDASVITTHLAMMHTLFNVTNTLLMLPFAKRLAGLVARVVPERKKGKVAEGPRYLGSAVVETPELALLLVSKEMLHMTEVVQQMFKDAMHILTTPEEDLSELVEETLQREVLADRIEVEIRRCLTLTARAATSAEASRAIAEMVQNTHRLERVADHCAVLVRIAQRNREARRPFEADDISDMEDLGSLVARSLEHVHQYLSGRGRPDEAERVEDQIDRLRRQLRSRHIDRLDEPGEDVPLALAFLDSITHLEEIGDRAVGIIRLSEAIKAD